MVAAFREHGGEGKRLALQVHLSWAEDEETALAVAYDQWRTNLFSPPVCWDLESVAQFDETARHVRREDVHEGVLRLRRSRPARRLARTAWPSLGFDEIQLHHVGQDLGPFVDGVRRARARPGAALMREKATSDLWWRNAVLYCLDVETFLDADGDGAATCPGSPSASTTSAGSASAASGSCPSSPRRGRDDGYDITDFYGVDPRLGTHGDFMEMVRTARRPRHPGDRRTS